MQTGCSPHAAPELVALKPRQARSYMCTLRARRSTAHQARTSRRQHRVSRTKDIIPSRNSTAAMSPTATGCRLSVALFFCGVWNFADLSRLDDSGFAAGTTNVGYPARTTGIRHSRALTSYVTPPSRVRSTRQSVQKLNLVSSNGNYYYYYLYLVIIRR